MSSLRFAGGAYCRAAGTRDAFGRASDHLVREGYPPITIVSGDREYAEQVGIFLARYVQAGDVRGRRIYDVRYWNGVAWYRISAAGTVAVPGTSNHESRRAADLGYPYNDRSTAAHRRLQQIAHLYGLKWTGVNFAEDWHWEFLGALGIIGAALAGGASTQEDDMGTIDDNSANRQVIRNAMLEFFEQVGPPRAGEEWKFLKNDHGISTQKVKDALYEMFVNGTGPADFGGRWPFFDLVAEQLWSHGIIAQDANGQPLRDGAGNPIQFSAEGYVASVNARVAALQEVVQTLAVGQGLDPKTIEAAAERGAAKALSGLTLTAKTK